MVAMQQDVMVSQRISQEIFCRSIHFYAYLRAAHIDVIGVLDERTRTEVILIQAFSAAFHDCHVSGGPVFPVCRYRFPFQSDCG